MNSPRITAAAKALCKKAASELGVSEADNWKHYGDLFIEDAKTAIKAADAIPSPKVQAEVEKLKRANAMLNDMVKHYREKYGVMGAQT